MMHTLVSATTLQKSIAEEFDYNFGPTIVIILAIFYFILFYFLHQEIAKKVGEVIAKTYLEKGIQKVVFDRGGYPYHGRTETRNNGRSN
ncbi:hypothetical protein IFM89_030948 [Coptis chinensis]|uniref:Uncharacterized protein n=1 Tax=Coptis chinensis TaxID=261450 RepID=A0A835IXW0_9MAGN|nr:hypothetical protein IFM89_030948 [Coptis chinensis]